MSATSHLRIGLLGADGRMGREVVRALADTPDAALAAAFTHANSDHLGADAGTVAGLAPLGIALGELDADSLATCDVLIDFSRPDATLAAAHKLTDTALVTGTTGQTDADLAALHAATDTIPFLRAGNFSLGVNLLAALVARAAQSLGPDYDIEIDEAHHRHKIDSPSGTAILLAEAAARGRGRSLTTDDLLADRNGARPPGAIGLSVRRAGGIVGDHAVGFTSARESLTLGHSALDRSVFAHGAIAAARWLHAQPVGRYTMADVLGL